MMADAGLILTKNRILQQLHAMLGDIAERQQAAMRRMNPSFPDEVLSISPKISRGENYRGLPYLVLDHPRFFSNEAVFAIRTMFWWGHYFSVTLHLSGVYKTRFEPVLAGARDRLAEKGFSICIHADPWQHHFERDNYLPVAELTAEEFSKQLGSHSFLKIGHALPLQQWEEADQLLMEDFGLIAHLLIANPERSTD